MPTFIALLRGVNVGKGRRVPMATLRELLAFTEDDEDLAPLGALEPLLLPGEGWAIGRHAAYLHCACGILESKAGAALLGKLGRTATTRNWATTLKLHAMAGDHGDRTP